MTIEIFLMVDVVKNGKKLIRWEKIVQLNDEQEQFCRRFSYIICWIYIVIVPH